MVVEIPAPVRPVLPLPEPVNSQPVEFGVLCLTDEPVTECDRANLRVTMTLDDSETLAANRGELLRFIREAMVQLRYYRQPEEQ